MPQTAEEIREKRSTPEKLAAKREYDRAYYAKNAEKRRAQGKAWQEVNQEHTAEYHREWYKLNRDRVLAQSVAYRKTHPEVGIRAQKKWRDKPENREKLAAYQREYRKDPLVYLALLLRVRLNCALKGNFKSGSAVDDLGCTIEELRQHLENHFRDGMTWENQGTYWEIDHIRPMISFDLEDREQLLQACHWSNLQPLTVEENRRKGGTWETKSSA